MAVNSEAFKETMAHWASGVTVITAAYHDQRVGITASAFNSVSLDPPRVLVCVAKRLYTHRVIEKSKSFAVNILDKAQLELGMRFAGRFPNIVDRFDGIQCETASTGCPLLPSVLGWLDCRLCYMYDAGDHTIFVGDVEASGMNGNGQPLLYYNRQWHQLASEMMTLSPLLPLHKTHKSHT